MNNIIERLINIFPNRDQYTLELFLYQYQEIKKISFKHLENQEFILKTQEFKNRLINKETIESILPSIFALIIEAVKRCISIEYHDVQVIGGLALNQRFVVEMATGEGKTYISIFASYTKAIQGKHVHIITVNDYLAKRDFENMKDIYNLLGISIDYITQQHSYSRKQDAYKADVVYLTASEAGFDYLRDKSCLNKDEILQQRPLDVAIVDEADSILIDEATVPLIISSGKSSKSAELNIMLFDNIAQSMLINDHYTVDEKKRKVSITDNGYLYVEDKLLKLGLIDNPNNLYSGSNIKFLDYLQNSIVARCLYRLDIDYVVNNNAIALVSDKTGRIQIGKKLSGGLHQAIEAKEKVPITSETIKVSSITLQNYFILYKELSGMTGTAKTEEIELEEIYGLKTLVLPRNKPCIRQDYSDSLFVNKNYKYSKIAELVQEKQIKEQPILIGTTSIENSEEISAFLNDKNIKHRLLNAKNHAQEALIIAQAGEPGAVTIATNMAGRGTDIVLGGNYKLKETNMDLSQWQLNNKKVIDAGGLFVIGTERNVSRRIDNQLIGRCGRQGDPGESKFFISLDDKLIRLFGGQRLLNSYSEYKEIKLPFINYFISSAQKKVEELNFKSRKSDLDYDNVIGEQRSVFYGLRDKILISTCEQYNKYILYIIKKAIKYCQSKVLLEETNPEVYKQIAINYLNIDISNVNKDNFSSLIQENINKQRQELFDVYSYNRYLEIEKRIVLSIIQNAWQDHINSVDDIKKISNLCSYAQKDPKIEFKRLLFIEFLQMMNNVFLSIVNKINSLSKEMQLI